MMESFPLAEGGTTREERRSGIGQFRNERAKPMKKLLSVTIAALLVAGLSAGSAFAKHRRYHAKTGYSGMMTGNAAMRGNHGNSASGSNSVGHIQGGNIGAGK